MMPAPAPSGLQGLSLLSELPSRTLLSALPVLRFCGALSSLLQEAQLLKAGSEQHVPQTRPVPGPRRSPGIGNGNPAPGTLAWKIPWTEEPGRLHGGCRESDMITHRGGRGVW